MKNMHLCIKDPPSKISICEVVECGQKWKVWSKEAMTSQKTKIVENLKVFENVEQIITKNVSCLTRGERSSFAYMTYRN